MEQKSTINVSGTYYQGSSTKSDGGHNITEALLEINDVRIGFSVVIAPFLAIPESRIINHRR